MNKFAFFFKEIDIKIEMMFKALLSFSCGLDELCSIFRNLFTKCLIFK